MWPPCACAASMGGGEAAAAVMPGALEGALEQRVHEGLVVLHALPLPLPPPRIAAQVCGGDLHATPDMSGTSQGPCSCFPHHKRRTIIVSTRAGCLAMLVPCTDY